MNDPYGIDDDRGYLYGDGLFETVRVHPEGRVRWLEWHIERFERSATWLGYPDVQIQAAVEVLQNLPSRRAGIWRVTVTRDDGDAPFGGTGTIRTRYRPYVERERPRLGIASDWYVPGDPLAEHKTTGYLRSIEVLRRARKAGYDDAVTVSKDGAVGECAWANIVVVNGERAVTPLLRGILPGVTRRGVINAYPGQVEVGRVMLDDIREADEIALLSAGVGALAAASIEGKPLDNQFSERLNAWLDEVRA